MRCIQGDVQIAAHATTAVVKSCERIGRSGFRKNLCRFLHHCHVVHVAGSSYRFWEMEHRTQPVGREG